MGSDYERIKCLCVKRGDLWEDPEFPAIQSSVFYHQTPPFQFVWKRPKELCPNPIFLPSTSSHSSLFDIIPGKLGDPWLVQCLGILHVSKELFHRVVPANQFFSFRDENKSIIKHGESDYGGIFRFRLWWCGDWREVLVDDRLPTVNGRLVFLHSQNGDVFWASLLEKAYAKLHGSYEALKYGTSLDGFADLTGGITESIPLRQDPTSCSRLLNKLLQMTSIVIVSVKRSSNSSTSSSGNINNNNNNKQNGGGVGGGGLIGVAVNEKLANGIQLGVNYRVYAVQKVETLTGEITLLVRLRAGTPTLVSEYIGSWSKASSEWNHLTTSDLEVLEVKNLAQGEFWMSYPDFLKTFTHMEVIHLDNETSRDELTLRDKMAWNVKQFQGSWMRGVTAGGCRNNADTFHINPQLHLMLGEMEEVVLSLNQHAIMDPKVIGFTVYPLSNNNNNGGNESIGKSFFKKNKSLINSQYTNSRQVSQRCQLEGGGYLVMPTTFEPGQETSFTLRVYSANAIKLRLIDSAPLMTKAVILKGPSSPDSTTGTKNFSQYEAVFLQLADEHRTISAFDLQELLEACLPNDYIKSCATLEVCRQFVIAMDKSGLGRLKFSQFKELMYSLKCWQNAFKSHTKEKHGVLKSERFRDALADVGFQLNNEIISVLILRFMRKDGTLRFGDFVGAILHLNVAFANYEKKDPYLGNGHIKLTLPEWLKLCLMC